MAHYTQIDGTDMEIKNGKTNIGGTIYDIKQGKTNIGGTVYPINLATEKYDIVCYVNRNDMFATTGDYLCNFTVRWAEYGAEAPDSVGWESDTVYKFSGVKPGSVFTAEVGADPYTAISMGLNQVYSFMPAIYYNGVLSGSFYDVSSGQTVAGQGCYYYNGTIYYNTYSMVIPGNLIVYANRSPDDYYSYVMDITDA